MQREREREGKKTSFAIQRNVFFSYEFVSKRERERGSSGDLTVPDRQNGERTLQDYMEKHTEKNTRIPEWNTAR